MSPTLQSELKQRKPFAGPEHEAAVSIMRTAALLDHSAAEVLKPFGLTPTQFNALRILRGAGEAGLCRNEVRDRLVAPVADATRLLDRLADAGLVVRSREGDDRRYVTARITPAGLELLTRVDVAVERFQLRVLSALGAPALRTLIDTLERVRAGLDRARRTPDQH